MQVKALHTTLKVIGDIVLLPMAAGIVYAVVISVTFWAGIGV